MILIIFQLLNNIFPSSHIFKLLSNTQGVERLLRALCLANALNIRLACLKSPTNNSLSTTSAC